MSNRTRQSDINAKERARQALIMRKAGYSLDEIATQLGYADKSGPMYAIKKALAAVTVDDAKALRQLEVARLDELLKVWLPRALDKKRENPRAADICLRVCERRSKLLGLDQEAALPQEQYRVLVRECIPGYLGEPLQSAIEAAGSNSANVL